MNEYMQNLQSKYVELSVQKQHRNALYAENSPSPICNTPSITNAPYKGRMLPKSTPNHTVYKPIDRYRGVTDRETPCCRNEVIPIADYMTGQTKLPPYLPYPKFLLDMDMTHTAKLLYALLLDRANLSQSNGWVDEQGRIYLIFPIEKIAEVLDKSCMTVKNALNELSEAGLIERKRQGFSAPNRIYVLLPDGQKTVP